jgi:hypothetical protein
LAGVLYFTDDVDRSIIQDICGYTGRSDIAILQLLDQALAELLKRQSTRLNLADERKCDLALFVDLKVAAKAACINK